MAVSPDGKEIALGIFGKSRERLWIVNSDGTNLRKFKLKIKKKEGIGGLSWSPDGKTIVWLIRGEKRGGSLWAIDRDGKNLRKLYPKDDIRLSSSHHIFKWSPDGRRVAFYTRDIGKNILAVDVKGGEIEELVDKSFFSRSKGWVERCQPAFSPDGKKIIFLKYRPFPKQDTVLCEFDLEKKELRVLNPLNLKEIDYSMGIGELLYSPDGKKIALEVRNKEGSLNIWTLNSDGSGLKELTREAKGSSWGPCFSPDGKKIAFFSGFVFARRPEEEEK